MLTPTGMAMADPTADNSTPEGRAANRRVYFDQTRMAAILSVAADTFLDPARFPKVTEHRPDRLVWAPRRFGLRPLACPP